MELARTKNVLPLPLIKTHCGLRLPPERHCLLSANYKLRASEIQPKKLTKSGIERSTSKNKSTGATILKRQSMNNANKTQNISIPKPVFKFSGNSNGKTNGTAQNAAAKAQPSTSTSAASSCLIQVKQEIKMEVEDEYSDDSRSFKRMREDDDEDDFEAVA